jgi:rhodanese-related sulfurtransferase
MSRIVKLAAVAAALYTPFASAADKPVTAKICLTCHKVESGNLRGYFDNTAWKSRSIQIRMDDAVEVVKFDPAKVQVLNEGKQEPAEFLRGVKKAHEIRIAFVEKDGVKWATSVSLKPPMSVPEEMVIKTAEVERLVAQGPEKGAYTLIDSRPPPRFQDGFIPTARNLPYPAFDKLVDRLPQDKSKLLVFYCQGPTCSMSPKSAEKAKALGYTNVKVYHEGIPGWSTRNPSLLTAQMLKEAWLDKGTPVVLLDARAQSSAQAGFIPGAVLVTSGPLDVAVAKLKLPPAEKKPPIVIYDGGKGEAADVARYLLAKGYGNLRLLEGGFGAWSKAAYASAAGNLGSTVAWAPKPRPGEIALEEFAALANAKPADTLILDVRADDEARQGMIKGAVNIPADQLEKRIAELPRDRRILTHCSTGVRAEMAYHVLKEKGFDKVAFLAANVAVDRKGTFKLSK